MGQRGRDVEINDGNEYMKYHNYIWTAEKDLET